MALREDTVIYPQMIDLAACLCIEMEALDGPALCYCGVVTGEVVMDWCGGNCSESGCGGQAWVRFNGAYPSITFPAQDGILSNCKSPLAYSLEVGVARCAPMGESGPNGYTPPTLEQHVEALRLQMADLAALRRAVICCFGEKDIDYILGAYDSNLVNAGGCLGGAFTVLVWEKF